MLQKVLAAVAVIGLIFVRGGKSLRGSSERSAFAAVAGYTPSAAQPVTCNFLDEKLHHALLAVYVA